jgi:hypothetical protein
MSKLMGKSPRNEKEGVKTRAKLVKQLEDGVKTWKHNTGRLKIQKMFQ